MRHFLTFISILTCLSFSFGQSAKEQDFIATINKVVTALAKRDSVTLSKFTDKKTGVYILNRIGVIDTYRNYKSLGFTDTLYPNVPFYDNVKLTALKYSTLPSYDCEKWSKTGMFVDTTRVDHLLSNIAKTMNEQEVGEVPAATINAFINLENKSRRVVIAADDGNELIFYLSFLNNKWLLTIIDKVTCDCSS